MRPSSPSCKPGSGQKETNASRGAVMGPKGQSHSGETQQYTAHLPTFGEEVRAGEAFSSILILCLFEDWYDS